MNSLFAVAENLLIDRLISNGAPFTGSNKAGLGLIALAGFMFLMSMGFFTWAAYIWMANNLDPLTAAIITGGITFLVASLCTLGAYALLKYKRYRIKKLKNEVSETINQVLAEFTGDEITQPIKDNPKSSALIASVAGLIVGDQILTRL